VAAVLPLTDEGWDTVAKKLAENFPLVVRDGGACKKKFYKMVNGVATGGGGFSARQLRFHAVNQLLLNAEGALVIDDEDDDDAESLDEAGLVRLNLQFLKYLESLISFLF
jgi:hypothetical protein